MRSHAGAPLIERPFSRRWRTSMEQPDCLAVSTVAREAVGTGSHYGQET